MRFTPSIFGKLLEPIKRRQFDTLVARHAGDAYVNLQLIEALQKKEIRQIPRLPGGNVIIDGNRLLEQLGVVQYHQNRAAPPPAPPQPELNNNNPQ